jgi:phage baseplate assembly protein W
MATNPNLQKAFLGVGWAYPVGIDPVTGLTARACYEDDVRQSLMIILGTARGERVMRQDFGCGIYNLAFAVIDTATLTRVESEVRTSIQKFEPRIELIDVIIDPGQAVDGLLNIEVDYLVRATNQVDNLVYPFYFAEGATS